ncbi:MAG: GNAT family N-acetyltransferase [Geminicoccaceae bacterium]
MITPPTVATAVPLPSCTPGNAATRPAAVLWDRLAGAHAIASHDWLTAIERASIPGLTPDYPSLPDGAGAAVCYEARDRRCGLDPTGLLLGRLAAPAERLGLSWLPALICAPYRGHFGHLLGSDPAAVLDRVEALADELGLPLHLPRVLDEDRRLCRLLGERGYHRTAHDPVARLDIAWDSFEGYLASLTRNARSAARGELRRNREAGVAIREIDDPATCADRVHRLLDDHNRRLNGVGVPFGRNFLPTLKAALGSRAILYGAWRDDRLVGVAVVLRQGDTAYTPYIGLDQERGAFTYFNLACYRPIADAIPAGVRRFYFGTMLYAMKVRRGCRVLPTSHFYRGRTRAGHLALSPWFKAHAWWARRHKYAAILALRPKTAGTCSGPG